MTRLLNNLLLDFTILFFVAAAILNLATHQEDQFSYLSQSFAQGKLYFLEKPGNWWDTVQFKDHIYWANGPFPAILLVPFTMAASVAGLPFYQGYLQILMSLGVFLLCYKLARLKNFSKPNALAMAFAFCFASIYQMVALMPWSWYFAQVITTLLLFLCIHENLTTKRHWLIGILLGLIFMTRFTAGIWVIYFLLDSWLAHTATVKKLKETAALLMPIIAAGILLLGYNQLRFGNIWDNGYKGANNWTATAEQRSELINHGLFKPGNIPTNIYYYFIKSPDPVLEKTSEPRPLTYFLRPPYLKVNFPGISFFWISPIFLLLLRSNVKNRFEKLSLLPGVLILLITLSYYTTGWRQVGPRYLLDILPFAYIWLLNTFNKQEVSNRVKLFVLLSAFFNAFLMLAVYFTAM